MSLFGKHIECFVIGFGKFGVNGNRRCRILFDGKGEVDFASFQFVGDERADLILVISEQRRDARVKVELFAVERADLDGDGFAGDLDGGAPEAGHGFYHSISFLRRKNTKKRQAKSLPYIQNSG